MLLTPEPLIGPALGLEALPLTTCVAVGCVFGLCDSVSLSVNDNNQYVGLWDEAGITQAGHPYPECVSAKRLGLSGQRLVTGRGLHICTSHGAQAVATAPWSYQERSLAVTRTP